MDNQMFCFQCEQTAGCAGGKGADGVCGKKVDTAQLQDLLTGALIGLARATEGNEYLINSGTDRLIIEGLFATITNVNFNNATISALIDKVHTEKKRLVPECFKCASACGRNDDYDMRSVWEANEDIRSLKSLILFGIRGMAAYAYHASVLGYHDETVNRFFYKALFAVGMDWDQDLLFPIVLEVGEVNLRCMELLDRANTETYGTSVPTEVPLTVEKGPFIVISVHDLYDLKQLLEQTKSMGINDLPLSMVPSWYEQKAVCILLTLLHLGVKNILLGSSLPAFISPNVLNLLVERYDIGPISTPEADLKRLLGE